MKNRSILLIAALGGLLFAGEALAAPTSFVTPTYIGEGTSNPGVQITLPLCASGDTVSFIMRPTRVLSLERGGNTTGQGYFTMVTALGAQAAGDSVSVAIDAGLNPINYSPGWVAVDTYASWLNTVGGNTTFGSSVAAPVKVAIVSAATFPPGVFWRVRILTKSTIAAGTPFRITFPRGNAPK
jgi:hypothetical protein